MPSTLPPAPLRTARALVALGFAAMSVLHVVPSTARGMALLVPVALTGGDRRVASALVRFTGLCEAAGAVGLMVPRTRRTTAAALIVFLAAVFPANVVAARRPDLVPAVAVPLVPRALLQVALAAIVAAVGLGGGTGPARTAHRG